MPGQGTLEVDESQLSATWHLSLEDIEDVEAKQDITSGSFTLLNHVFKLGLYPKREDTSNGQASIYLFPEGPATINWSFTLAPMNFGIVSRTFTHTFEQGFGYGTSNMCATPTGTFSITMKLLGLRGEVALDERSSVATWTMAREEVATVQQQQAVFSQRFALQGHNMRFQYFPRGDIAGNTFGCLYLYSEQQDKVGLEFLVSPGHVARSVVCDFAEVGHVGLRDLPELDSLRTTNMAITVRTFPVAGAVTLDSSLVKATWSLGQQDLQQVLWSPTFTLRGHALWLHLFPHREGSGDATGDVGGGGQGSRQVCVYLHSEQTGALGFEVAFSPGNLKWSPTHKFTQDASLCLSGVASEALESGVSITVEVFDPCEALQLRRKVEELADMLSQGEHDRSARRVGSALALQRAWRGVVVRGRVQREKEERTRIVHRARFILYIRIMQRLWRKRQQTLRHYKAERDAWRMRSPTTKYDVILTFESLSEFITTGKIDILQSVESLFRVAEANQYRIVAVVGLFDKGKTFCVNKTFGVNLPSGKLCTTKGLSFCWVKEQRMLILDSAGVQATVSYRSQAVQPILDAQTTESLVFEMISRMAHHMIFVVSDLTWFEQKYIAMLHQKYVQTRQAKELVVVHNLRTTGVVLEAQELFARQITQCYDGQVSHLGDLVFTADHGANVPHVHHIGICQDATAAGRHFNDKNCTLLLQMLELRDMLGSKIILSELLSQELARLLPTFLNVEVAAGDPSQASLLVEYITTSRPHLEEQMCACELDDAACGAGGQGWAQQDFGQAAAGPVLLSDARAGAAGPGKGTASEGYVRTATLALKTPRPGSRVSMKTRGVISPLGEIIAHDVSFDPIVNIYDKSGEQEVWRYILVECPGVTDDDIELEELANGVKLIIEKKKGIDEVVVQPVTPIRQHHGKWEREFLFDASEGKFELVDSEDSKLEHGVLTLVLRKQLQARKWKLRGGGGGAQLAAAGAASSPSLGGLFGALPPTGQGHPTRSGEATPTDSISTIESQLVFVPEGASASSERL